MIKAILIDLSGTLHIENCVINGAVNALKRYTFPIPTITPPITSKNFQFTFVQIPY